MAGKKKSAEQRKEELDAPRSADIGEMEAIDAPDPADEPAPKKGNPDGRKPVGQDGPFTPDDYEHIVGEDKTKPEGKQAQSIYVEKKKGK